MAIKRCTSSFVPVRGVPRVIKVGQLFNDDDPIIQGREHLFEDVEAHVQERTRVEQATAEPGRRRSLTRPTRRATAPKASAKPKAAPKPKAEEPGTPENPDVAATQEGTSS